MTTKITVDAHAGWPVEVEFIDIDPNPPVNDPGHSSSIIDFRRNIEIVEPFTTKDFHVWDTRSLIIRELKR